MNNVKENILRNNLFTKESRLLLAVSGGADSICLFFILKDLGYKIEIAHCNFKLRDIESDGDEIFVKQLAKRYSIKCHTKSFMTKKFAEEGKISIQMAARDLRYEWFEDLASQYNFDYILTGHHKDDNIETFLINLIRGSGISGLCGMQLKSKRIYRPLLTTSKSEIEEYLIQNNIKFRYDSSNADVKYLRNKIRHEVIPLLSEINPSIHNTIANEIHVLNGISKVFNDKIRMIRDSLIVNCGEQSTINISDLTEIKNLDVILFELLRPFGIFEVKKIIKSLNSQSGKQFFSDSHHLIIDREKIIISLKGDVSNVFDIDDNAPEITEPLLMSFKTSIDTVICNDKHIAKLDFNKLTFPLKLRKWEKGDKFKPLGMQNFKKLSDFFVDEKYSIIDKKNQWILCSNNHIVWIVGQRIDDRYKIAANTKKTYIAKLLKQI